MNHRQKAAILGAYLADKRGEDFPLRKVTADALIERGLLERTDPFRVKITEAGRQWMAQYEFAPD